MNKFKSSQANIADYVAEMAKQLAEMALNVGLYQTASLLDDAASKARQAIEHQDVEREKDDAGSIKH